MSNSQSKEEQLQSQIQLISLLTSDTNEVGMQMMLDELVRKTAAAAAAIVGLAIDAQSSDHIYIHKTFRHMKV